MRKKTKKNRTRPMFTKAEKAAVMAARFVEDPGALDRWRDPMRKACY